MNKKILRNTQNDHYHIAAVSDIHGHLSLFEQLMYRLSLSEEDYLVVIGDFINKGPDSLGSVRKMMALHKRPNTYILKGNHEYFICKYVYNQVPSDGFLNYLKEGHFPTIIEDCLKELSLSLEDFNTMSDLQKWLLTYYKDEFDFINTLPVILFFDDLTFVHGGYSKDIDIHKDENRLLKFDDYNRLSDINDGTVIVGHWPVANLRTDKKTNRPFFNHEKRIISIDGGVGVTTSGELNGLIIDKQNNSRTIGYIQENHFEKRIIKKTHTFLEEEKIFVNYPHFDIEILEAGTAMSRCRHLQSGKELSIFNSLLETVDGKPQVITTYINHFLNLPEGETVELVMTYEDCALVKHGGEFGWIWHWQL